MEQQIRKLLDGIRHPETGEGLVTSGFVDRVEAAPERIAVCLRFAKARDPFAQKIKREVEELLRREFPHAKERIVYIKEAEPKKTAAQPSSTGGIARVVAVASGKGGVGKSTVAANLALTLRNMGYRTGLLDADIYGPSQPGMFGVEGYVPDAEHDEASGADRIVPAEAMDVKLMSIGFFIRPTDALMWRGVMATNALKQLIHQTRWGTLDVLVVDLPPGTGDVHLSILSELKLSAAVIVSTPQRVAVADVVRGVEMFRHPQVNVPVAGIVENMAWFTPEELPDKRYYLFGRGGARSFAERSGIDFLGEIPIIQSIMDGAENGCPAVLGDPRVEEYYRKIAEKIVDKVMK